MERTPGERESVGRPPKRPTTEGGAQETEVVLVFNRTSGDGTRVHSCLPGRSTPRLARCGCASGELQTKFEEEEEEEALS